MLWWRRNSCLDYVHRQHLFQWMEHYIYVARFTRWLEGWDGWWAYNKVHDGDTRVQGLCSGMVLEKNNYFGKFLNFCHLPFWRPHSLILSWYIVIPTFAIVILKQTIWDRGQHSYSLCTESLCWLRNTLWPCNRLWFQRNSLAFLEGLLSSY